MSEEKECTPEETADVKKRFWADMLYQIVDSPRFLAFMEKNYVVQKGVDEETKTIHVRCIEKPIDPPPPPPDPIKLQFLLMSAGVKDPVKLSKAVFKMFGADALVEVASKEDLDKAALQHHLKKKLDV